MNNTPLPPTFVERPPRIQPPLPIATLEIPPPPDKKGQSQPLFQVLLPVLTIIGYALVSVMSSGRNLLMLIPMALTVVATTGVSIYTFVRERRRIRELERAYAERLRRLRHEMNGQHTAQRLYYQHTHPDIETVYRIAVGREISRLGARLWERRPLDHDFGSLRIGVGDVESRVVYQVTSTSDNTEDTQMYEAQQLAEDSQIVRAAPVIIPLRPYQDTERPNAPRLSGHHSLGVAGQATIVINFAQALMMQFSTFHSPLDTQLYVIGAPHAGNRWGWMNLLPHTRGAQGQAGEHLCFMPPLAKEINPREVAGMHPKQFWTQIHKELEDRRLRLEEKDNTTDVTLPFLLVVVDNLPSMEAGTDEMQTTHWLDDAVSEAAVSHILNHGQELGAAMIFLVPTAAQIPSDCVAVIEVQSAGEDYAFQYSEIGKNTARFVGGGAFVSPEKVERAAQVLKDKSLRVGYGSNLPAALSVLDLYGVRRIHELPILPGWEKSRARGKGQADWLRVKVGAQGSGDKLELYLNQDYDGVHGMIAGTTGSGKSELLLTLIADLAMNYDPQILNFILVDYKGGAAFEPFRTLPHCVDILTNQDGKAVDRMFVALDAELRRRSTLLPRYNVKHIVEYREKGYHQTAEPFPHLFIIVDEFAEMLKENKEYKVHFDSITRLGRAIGVHLLLATQRPSGYVTDQMRANMKLRICLRVETPDDSRELLGRSDAVFLPSSIPGRAYLQVGKDTPMLVQVARSGGNYTGDTENKLEQDIFIGVMPTVATSTPDENPPTIVDLIVTETRRLASQHSQPQHKPYPDPLPLLLPLNYPLDARHLVLTNTDTTTGSTETAGTAQHEGETGAPDALPRKQDNRIVLNQRVRDWMERASEKPNIAQRLTRWQAGTAVDWEGAPLQVTIGLIDMPSQAQQRLLTIDLTLGPLILFGTSGMGKTTFLLTLLTALAAAHSPRELHLYALDFARGGLEPITHLPHLVQPIDVVEEPRVERLLRMMANTLDERQKTVRDEGSLIAYNRAHPDNILPAIVVVIDNFSEFKEIYEAHLTQLASLIRAGRALGVYFIVTADQVTAVPSRLYSLFTQRLTLKLADAGDYQSVVGRGAHILTEEPGRGLITVEREPREFHLAVPTRYRRIETDATTDTPPQLNTTLPQTTLDKGYSSYFRELAYAMRDVWGSQARPPAVEALAQVIPLQPLLKAQPTTQFISAVLGMNDIDRAPLVAEFITHCLILGSALSGKTTLLQTLVLSLAARYTSDEVAFVLIDSKRQLFEYGGALRLNNLPHVISAIAEAEELPEVVMRLRAEFDSDIQQQIRTYASEEGVENAFLPQRPQRQLIIIVDNYDDIGDFETPRFDEILANLARRYRAGLHIILAGTPEILKNKDALIKRVETARYGIVLQSTETVTSLGGRIPYNLSRAELPVGRGFIVKSGQAELFQVAQLWQETETIQALLDKHIGAAMHTGTQSRWYYSGTVSLYQRANQASVQAAPNAIREIEISEDVNAEMQRIMQDIARATPDTPPASG